MWIRRQIFDALRDELVEQRTRAATLAEHTATHRTQTGFLVARINQLEKERAIMLKALTKLEIPVPELTAIAPPINADAVLMAAMGSSMFDDMGDTEAQRQGVRWSPDGTVEYAAPARGK